jgi:hypothetical protein
MVPDTFSSPLSVLTWMVGFSLAVQVATPVFIWQILLRLPTS